MVGSDLIAALGGGVVPFTLGAVEMWLRPLTAEDMVSYQAMPQDVIGRAKWLISRSVVSEMGTPILTEEDAGKLPVKAVKALGDRIAELNGFPVKDPEGGPGKAQ